MDGVEIAEPFVSGTYNVKKTWKEIILEYIINVYIKTKKQKINLKNRKNESNNKEMIKKKYKKKTMK